jgi:hypothetical protein
MAITGIVNLSVQVSGGPTVAASWNTSVDTYDRSTVNVDINGDAKVNLLPGAGTVKFVLITASSYDPKLGLTYQFDAVGPFKLTEPQILAGGDVISKLDATPKVIEFKNGNTAAVTVDIFVLRQAV